MTEGPADERGGRHMTPSAIGIIAGMLLGIAGAFGGFGAFVIVLFLGAVGFVVGRVLEGKTDVESFFGRWGRRRE